MIQTANSTLAITSACEMANNSATVSNVCTEIDNRHTCANPAKSAVCMSLGVEQGLCRKSNTSAASCFSWHQSTWLCCCDPKAQLRQQGSVPTARQDHAKQEVDKPHAPQKMSVVLHERHWKKTANISTKIFCERPPQTQTPPANSDRWILPSEVSVPGTIYKFKLLKLHVNVRLFDRVTSLYSCLML